MTDEEMLVGLKHIGKRVSLPCPDGLEGCLVHHFGIETDPVAARAIDRIEALQADNARLLRANHVLRLGLSGMVDSEDALNIADAMTRGDGIDWDQYPEATRKALVKPRVLFASLHNRVLTDAEIDQIIKERSDDT
jgi:hypothetical protein